MWLTKILLRCITTEIQALRGGIGRPCTIQDVFLGGTERGTENLAFQSSLKC